MRTCPQVSMLPDSITLLPFTLTEPTVARVFALQCDCPPGRLQGWCGVTAVCSTAIGRPLTRTELSPDVINPPAEFGSPNRCTEPTYYPIIIDGLRTALIPVVASR